jgi:VIT1/CCC1 family predicted Fe2+/Mn2+ transporter
VALFALGAVVSLLTHRPPLLVGARQALLGLAAAAITYGIGAALGVAMG